MKKIILLTTIATSFLFSDASLYAKCVGCHGANGEKKALGRAAVIKGQSAEELNKKLLGYKEGKINVVGMGGLMKSQVVAMDDAQIKTLSEHIATFK